MDRLVELLRSYGRIALGFSGGVDSTFLAAVCARHLPDRVTLVHLSTPFVGTPERASAERGMRELGLPCRVVELDPLDTPAIAANPTDRCYRCKRAAFARILQEARELGADTVIDGSNADDADDYRPGMRAIQELGVRSPLMETGWHKEAERAVLRDWDIPVWNMPAGACLATRIATGEPLTPGKLALVRAAEDYLRELGLVQVRLRIADGCAQVAAAPDDLATLRRLGAPVRADGGVELPAPVAAHLQELGCTQLSPIVLPYRQGAMNKERATS